MRKIMIIPPKPPEHKRLKAVACCCISTLGSAQRLNLNWQIKSYIKMISEHLNWIFTGVFFDTGKSGLRRNGRTGLEKMPKKTTKGKFDCIITKFISMVLRDIMEILKIVRYLRERRINPSIEIYICY
ncbi:recombinase family protein [Clostridium sp. Marseille-Q7071]